MRLALPQRLRTRRPTRRQLSTALAVLALAALAAGWGSGPLGLVPAACSLPFLLVVHALTGFTGPEEKLVSGQDLTDAELARYLRLNLPLHVIYACVYAASALVALVAALA